MAPTLIYFPVAGRGELSRLIAMVGGIEDFQLAPQLPEGHSPGDYGSTGSLPCLLDDDLKINESGAIEMYLSMIAPKFADLTPKQRAKDAQLAQLKETYLSSIAKVIFAMSPEERASGAKGDQVKEVVAKYFPILEAMLPDEGYINQLDYPTPADLAVVNICEAYMPFACAYKIGGVDLSVEYPKIHRLSERTKKDPDVAKYTLDSATLKTVLPGF